MQPHPASQPNGDKEKPMQSHADTPNRITNASTQAANKLGAAQCFYTDHMCMLRHDDMPARNHAVATAGHFP